MIKSRMQHLLSVCLSWLIPTRCDVCGEPVDSPHTLCSKCFSQLNFITKPYCPICGRPFEFQLSKDLVCGSCMKKHPKYTKARAVVVYDDMSKKLLLPYKHGDRTDLTPLLVKLLYQAGQELFPETDIIIPVPLHQTRLMKRRYNQAALLANSLARMTNLTYVPHSLRRSHMTKSQGHLSAKERQHNVTNAFTVVHPKRIKGKRVLLIDDVYTTGATVNACAKALLHTGAKSVFVLTFAKVVKDQSSSESV